MPELDDTAPVKSGDVLAGKYRVERVLGIGGMGVVVAATHLQLEQRVALKFMLPFALSNAMAVERFAREARAAVRLKSEHVARVLDVGTLETGSPFLVMEFLEGFDLHDLIHERGERISVEDAVDYVLQACDAVAEAHGLGIVHRDLKPRNLFVSTGNDGKPQVKVLDFGISKVNSGGGDLSLTRTSEIMGSPNYMSPEQLRASRDVDGRTDIWALGVILYELLGGKVPFVAETLTQLTAMVLTEPPKPLKDLRPDVPLGLVQVVSRCLEKDMAKRFGSVAELAGALSKFASPHSRALVDRVRRVEAAARGPGSQVPADRSSARVVVQEGTEVSWGETELAAPKKATGRWVLIGAAVAVVLTLGGGGVFLGYRHGNAVRGDIASPTQVPSPAPPSPTAQAPTLAPQAPSTGAPEMTSAAPAPTSASAATTSSPATAPKPQPTAPKPHSGAHAAHHDASVDDVPSDRL
jgi:tRNA A-37 threonylcarbamoyl transferase component Bud32